MLDGAVLADTQPVVQSGRLQKIDGLFDALKQRRMDHPEQKPKVELDIAQDTPAVVVKSVFQTAAFAGVSDITFVALPKTVPE